MGAVEVLNHVAAAQVLGELKGWGRLIAVDILWKPHRRYCSLV